tara:strand:+ start:1095 stop:2402 length:1308 start_codon:yes stop_codon:yes gene_type:complete
MEVIIISIFSAISALLAIMFFVTKTQANHTIKELKTQLSQLQTLIAGLQEECQLLTKQRYELDAELKIEQQKVLSQEQQMKIHLEASRASILKAGSELSSKLLDDHKREALNAQKQQEERIKATTEQLHQQFKHVFESMHHLSKRMQKVDTIERALLSPQGAGALAEVTLENIFKSSGLIAGQDYVMQHFIKDHDKLRGGLKPDAVVFLPGDHVMVIDSKASKFFMDLGAIDNQQQRDHVYANIRQSMTKHLKDLITKDYKQAIDDQLKSLRKKTAGHTVVMMFLPTESAMETLRKTDKQFEEKAWAHHIIPVGPSGLVNALLQAKLAIFRAKQEQHSEEISQGVKKLLASIGVLQSTSESLGKSLKSSMDKYDKFAGSFNRNFLSKAKQLQSYYPDDKPFNKLHRYQVVTSADLIEGVAEDVEEKQKTLANQES